MNKSTEFKIPYLFLLAFSATLISVIGATFSVTGLAKLFSGAPVAVMVMAGALEFSKVVCAGFLHQNWKQLSGSLKTYLALAVFVLMTITSLGIFGYLSHAYQKVATALNNAQIKVDYLHKEDAKIQDELLRVQNNLDIVPDSHVSQKLALQKEMEPQILQLKKRSLEINSETQRVMVEMQAYQSEIGPLVYVAQAFNMKMDQVARWFILLFVSVFDPLAICLVFATSWSLQQREKERQEKLLDPKAQPFRMAS